MSNFAVLTHAAANTPEFLAGCPGEWPYTSVPIGRVSQLPKELPSPSWIIETEEQLRQRMLSLESVKEAWNKTQEEAQTAPKRTREEAIRQAIIDLRTIRDTPGNLTGAQLSNAVRSIARTLLALIDELGN